MVDPEAHIHDQWNMLLSAVFLGLPLGLFFGLSLGLSLGLFFDLSLGLFPGTGAHENSKTNSFRIGKL